MDDLIKALQIFSKYTNAQYPTYCTHDAMHVLVDPWKVSTEDKEKLDTLGFLVDMMNYLIMVLLSATGIIWFTRWVKRI